ncbi:uncharacterized protein LOC124455068 isoform X3 [Xenia sp. Carnegie-2017]|uniref:uncharacterized protein LOC124455068 isoform X3 n=1 Tax=Xenia sp. Carnegie-2017 TaxID=2897299 RepID=UPI001F0476A1|nr:uncharacterized protein LOC124455068 isoform X3 [Xenia sp. Carnegie-2017]
MFYRRYFILVLITSWCDSGNFANDDNQWPSGNFGLPKAKTGCPGDWKSGWREGWRFQDMEDGYPSSVASVENHMAVTFPFRRSGININRTFCMLNQINKKTRSWPKGTYCIYKSRNTICPNGMSHGFVKWDDENKYNINKKGGYLPDGIYNRDTRIYYCCQTNGNWYDSIELPVIKPFYLLTSSSLLSPKCQMVMWATSQMEYILFNTEHNNNRDYFSGNHVFEDTSATYNSRTKLYYCYYKDCRDSLIGPSGSISSYNIAQNEMDPHSQYCSWLITVAETFVISLKFSILNIPQCNDAFLFIYNGPNNTSPLLGKYCGQNATAGMEIRSSTNYLFIVGNSGSYGSRLKSVFDFHADYNSEHAVCHRDVIENSGTLKSPIIDTPVGYPRRSNCSWLITVDVDNIIMLNFSMLNVGDDDLTIYDGINSSAPLLRRYFENSKYNTSLVSSTNSIYILLKFVNYKRTDFVLEYNNQPRPTEEGKTTTLPSSFTFASTTQDHEKRAKSRENQRTTYIIVAVVIAGLVLVIVVIVIIFLIRKKRIGTNKTFFATNLSYSFRKETRTKSKNDESTEYAVPSSPQEKIWNSGSKICKEGRNPIYHPADDGESTALYSSTDDHSIYVNEYRAADSKNPLYAAGVSPGGSNEYAEPDTSQNQEVVYTEPDV